MKPVAKLHFISALALAIIASRDLCAATISSNWLGGTGAWTDSTKWSSNPNYPNNGTPAGSTYDAVIDTSASSAISLTSSVTLDNLVLDSPTAAITHTAGTLQANILHLQAGTYTFESSGAIKNTTIQDDGGTGQLVIKGGPTLDHVTLNMDLPVPFDVDVRVQNGLTLADHDLIFTSGSRFIFNDSQPLDGTGEIVVNSKPSSSGFRTNFYASAGTGTFVIGPSITFRTGVDTGGSQGIVLAAPITGSTGLFHNEGTISCETADATVELKGTWVNDGTIKISDGTLLLNGFFTPSSIADHFVRTGGTVRLTGQVNAAGQTLVLDQSTGSWDFTGKIIGGRVQANDGTQLRAINSSPIPALLDSVTLAAPLQMDLHANVRVNSSLTLDGASIRMMSGSSSTTVTILDFVVPTTVGGMGEILFQGGKTLNSIQTYNETGPVTFGPGVTIRADTGGGAIQAAPSSPITIQGRVVAGPGVRQVGFSGPITMSGYLQIDPGGEIPTVAFTNLAAGTLTGGTFSLGTGSILRVLQAISTNSATIALDGSGSSFYVGNTGTTDALAALATNSIGSSLLLTGGRSFTVPNPFLNNGTVYVGAGSAFSSNGLTDAVSGLLAGSGTIGSMVANSGRIAPGGLIGSPYGRLSFAGNLTLDSSSQLAIEVGGSTNSLLDSLNVGGTLSLGGSLQLSLLDGYLPVPGTKFDVFDFGHISGTFNSLVLPGLPPGESWDTTHLYDTGMIGVVPEPDGVAILAVGMLCVALWCQSAIRRRRAVPPATE